MKLRINTKLEYLYFFLFPFFSFIWAIKNYKNLYFKSIITLFVGFYGFMITTPKNEVDMDIFRRIEHFESFVNDKTTFSFNEFITEFNTENSYYSDPFEDFMMYCVSRVTSNYRILFLVYGLMFGYIFSSNIWYVLDKYEILLNGYNKLFFFLLFLAIPFWNITIFRFYFASQVFLYGLIRYFDNRKIYYLFFSMLSILIHFSFLYAMLIFAIYFIFKNRFFICYCFLVLSFFIGISNISSLSENIKFLPNSYENKLQGYTRIEYVTKVLDNKTSPSNRWYLNLKNNLIQYALFFLYTLIFINRKYLNKSSKIFKFLNFSVIFFASCLIVENIPSMDRFFTIAYYLSSIVGLIIFNKKNLKLVPKMFSFLFYPLIGLYLIVELRIGFETIGLLTIFGNIYFMPFADYNIALIDIIKYFI